MRNKLLFSLAGAAFGFATGGFAFAADMPVKAPAAPAPVYSWTGWYAGVNAGASFGNVKTDFNVGSSPFSEIVSPISGGTATADFTVPGFAGSDTTSPDGFIGGGQIGYNWQFSPIWVGGLEADFQGALERDHTTLPNNFSTLADVCPIGTPCGPVLVSGSSPLSYQTKIDWFGTVRARLGYVWGNGEVMSYVTGGLAYGRVSIDGTRTPLAIANETLPFSLTQAFSNSHVNTGWVVGYGTEGHLPLMPGNWTWKIEGLYMDLGHLDATAPGASGGATVSSPSGTATLNLTAGPVSAHSHFTDGILRGGLNYQFH